MKHGLFECDVGTETKMKSCSIDDHCSQQPSEVDIRIPFPLLEQEGVFSTREAEILSQRHTQGTGKKTERCPGVTSQEVNRIMCQGGLMLYLPPRLSLPTPCVPTPMPPRTGRTSLTTGGLLSRAGP